MNNNIDTNVLIAAMIESEPFHAFHRSDDPEIVHP